MENDVLIKEAGDDTHTASNATTLAVAGPPDTNETTNGETVSENERHMAASQPVAPKLVEPFPQPSQSFEGAGIAARDPSMSESTPSLGEIAQAYQRRSLQASQARYKNLALRTELQNQWSVWHHKRGFFRDSSKEFMAKLNSAKAEGSLKRSAARLNKLHTRMLDDYDALEEQAKKTLLLESERSNHELSLQSLEKSLDNAIHALFTALNGNTWIGGASVIPETDFERSPANSVTPDGAGQQEMHPALEHYYDCLGDVRLMQERLSGLDFSHTEDTILRGLRADQDIPPEQSDEDFERMWQSELGAATAEYETALEHLKLAIEACQALDITPQTPNRLSVVEDEASHNSPTAFKYDAFSPPNSIPVWEVIAPAEDVPTPLTGPIVEGEGVLSYPSLAESLRAMERIRSWISMVPEAETHTEQPEDGSQSEPTRRGSLSDVFAFTSRRFSQPLTNKIDDVRPSVAQERPAMKLSTAPPSPRHSKRASGLLTPLPSTRAPFNPP